MATVAIFGGGVAGLTAAMELAQRGVEVTVYERHAWGGKVRCTEVPGSGVGGRKNLPLEHGFHFFPTFYRHLPDTMSRIPTGCGRSVADNLVPGSQELISRSSAPPVLMPSKFPRTLAQWRVFLTSLFQLSAGVPTRELQFFVTRMLQFMAMCPERREVEVDRITWWDFVGAQTRSREYQKLVARMPSQLLLAAPARRVSARTVGHAFMGMVEAGLVPGGNIDRSLNAPPCRSWINPWVRMLSARVKLVLGASLERFEVDRRRGSITSASVNIAGTTKTVVADSYLCALPVEVVRRFWTPEITALDPNLTQMRELDVTWMCGLQLFLTKPRPLAHGHVAHADTAWALTSVSQAQFWQDFDFARHGDGTVRDLVSIIIGDWDRPGTQCVYKTARECSGRELFEETFAQFQASLVRSGRNPLADGELHGWALDPDLSFANGQAANAEPLFMSTAGAWARRPTSQTLLANLFLAGDYVRTQIDFASAEGACEGGRRAANAILAQYGYRGRAVPLWSRAEPRVLAPFRLMDRRRLAQGLPPKGPPLPLPRTGAPAPAPGEVLARLAARHPREKMLLQQSRAGADDKRFVARARAMARL